MEPRPRTVKAARLIGIDIFVHYSWLLIAGLILLSFWGQLEAANPTVARSSIVALAVLGTAIFFGSVLVHELAHAVMARRRGIEVKGITLYLFGGATEADASSQSATDEFVIAIVGPLTSLATAAALWFGAIVAGGDEAPLPDLLGYLALINVLLAAFNMVPGLPLDGGRVFRSVVWGITDDFAKATTWATNGGVIFGYVLVSLGLLTLWQGSVGGLWLVAIGWMISQSAKQNEQQEQLRAEFRNLVAADLMTSPVVTIPAQMPIATTVRSYFSQRAETSFPVVDGNRISGMLSIAGVRQVPTSEIWQTTAGRVALKGEAPIVVGRRTPMVEVIAAMESRPRGSLRVLVVEDDIIVGIISPSDLVRRHAIAGLLEAQAMEAEGLRSQTGAKQAAR